MTALIWAAVWLVLAIIALIAAIIFDKGLVAIMGMVAVGASHVWLAADWLDRRRT